MRIISQDGRFDLPYETTPFLANKKSCEIEAFVNENFDPVMAIYSTYKKCLKAMEMLRESYGAHLLYQSMSEIQKSVYMSSVTDKQQLNLTGVFIFPKNNEVDEYEQN